MKKQAHLRALGWLAALAALWLCPLAPSLAADLAVMPVTVHLDRQRDRGIVQVTNQGTQPVVLQAEAIAWRREAGVDSDAPTSDLIVNPPVFTIAPGRTQLVRVGLRRSGEAEHEATYRMVLREVPAADGSGAGLVHGQVRVLMALRLPVYVAPSAVRREQRWVARYDEQGQLHALVRNTGNVHYKIDALRWPGDSSPAAVPPKGPAGVLFPGEEISFALRAPVLPASAGAGPLTLEVFTDQGLQHVALALPAR